MWTAVTLSCGIGLGSQQRNPIGALSIIDCADLS